MHKIGLISVGKIKTLWIKDGCRLYAERIGHACSFSERVLSAGSKTEENDRVLKALEKIDGCIVLLSEEGKEFSSQEFSAWIGVKRDTGTPVTFVLCGAYGADERLLKKAVLVVSLSRMTFPHEVCQLVFLEQLYRAQEILKGSGYHH